MKEWSAPETRSQLAYSAKCDMWSAGLILSYMVKHIAEFRPIKGVEALIDSLLSRDPR